MNQLCFVMTPVIKYCIKHYAIICLIKSLSHFLTLHLTRGFCTHVATKCIDKITPAFI